MLQSIHCVSVVSNHTKVDYGVPKIDLEQPFVEIFKLRILPFGVLIDVSGSESCCVDGVYLGHGNQNDGESCQVEAVVEVV